ncbi:MAG: MgtC/SapB family protein [Cellulosilyticaceae bacterium]
MVEVLQYLEEFNEISVLVRLSLAVFLGGIIGAERATKKQTAGIRTFAVVCLGAALATITNEYLCIRSGMIIDTSRMAGQVISGVGFLGVGTIIVTGKNQVKGLTTAASLWTVATLGIAIGSGFIYGALVGFVLILISVKLLHQVSRSQENHNRILEVYMEVSPEGGIDHVMSYIHEKQFIIRSMQRSGQNTFRSEDIAVTMELDLKIKKDHESVLKELQQVKGLDYIEEIH